MKIPKPFVPSPCGANAATSLLTLAMDCSISSAPWRCKMANPILSSSGTSTVLVNPMRSTQKGREAGRRQPLVKFPRAPRAPLGRRALALGCVRPVRPRPFPFEPARPRACVRGGSAGSDRPDSVPGEHPPCRQHVLLFPDHHLLGAGGHGLAGGPGAAGHARWEA